MLFKLFRSITKAIISPNLFFLVRKKTFSVAVNCWAEFFLCLFYVDLTDQQAQLYESYSSHSPRIAGLLQHCYISCSMYIRAWSDCFWTIFGCVIEGENHVVTISLMLGEVDHYRSDCCGHMWAKLLKLWPEDWSQNSWSQDLNRPRVQTSHKMNKLGTVLDTVRKIDME